MTDVESLFANAVKRHQAGDLAGAEQQYGRTLAIDPAHVDALHLRGVVFAQTGRPNAAVELIGRAVALSPDFALAHYNLANALRALGRDEEALAAYRRSAELKPNHAPSHGAIGALLRQAGRPAEAVDAFARAAALTPNEAQAHANLGSALADVGRHDDAVAAYRRALTLKPDNADALVNLGASLHALKRLDQAFDAFRRALATQPDHVEAQVDLGAVLQDLGRFEEACSAFRRALELRPDDASCHVRLGASLQELGRHEAAVAAHRRALELRPGYADAEVSLAVALQELGQADAAREATTRALAADPASARAWFVRSDLKRFAPGDGDLGAMEALLADGASPRSEEDRIDLEFALGKAWMDAGDAGRAFSHLAAGNGLVRVSLDYDADADLAGLAAIARAFTPDLPGRFAGTGCASQTPVFIVGMPRSGTSLVEQVLASHPDVHGAGELALLGEVIARGFPHPYPNLLASLRPGDLGSAGDAYASCAADLAPSKARVVDKMPGNFRFAGLIHLMLPNARIIHCRRDPVDTCLSCYSRKFAGRQDFAYDLSELGRYYRGYEALMDHWRATLPPDRFTEAPYEDLVDDLEGQARRLIAFLGLDWNDACLDFHANPRTVRTASVNQVRQPIYRTSLVRWKPYARHLASLLAALGVETYAAEAE